MVRRILRYNNNQTLLEIKTVTIEEVEAALRHYCRFHIKDGELEQVPELKRYITNNNNVTIKGKGAGA